MLIEVLFAGFVVMLASLVGVIFLQKTAQSFLETRLPYLISFSAGVFLLVSGALIFEVFEVSESLWQGALFVVIGYLLAFLLHKILPETHHHHDPSCRDSHKAARKIIIGDSIHNIADGIVLVGAFAVSPALGVAVTVSVFIHEALQEISEFFILRQGGYSVRKALSVNFLVSSTIFIGILLGYFALASHDLEVFLLALSAGFFLQVVFHDLLPRPSHSNDRKQFSKHFIFVVLGVLVMGLVASALGESHGHGDEQHTSHESPDDHDSDHHEEESVQR